MQNIICYKYTINITRKRVPSRSNKTFDILSLRDYESTFLVHHVPYVVQLCAKKEDDLHDRNSEKCISFLPFRYDIKYRRGVENYWHPRIGLTAKLESRSRSRWHYSNLSASLEALQNNKSEHRSWRTITINITRWLLLNICDITLAVYRIGALKFSAATRSTRYRRDRLSASCTSIAGRDCNNCGNCVANSLCRVRETAMLNVAKCVFMRFCDVPGLRNYNLRRGRDSIIYRLTVVPRDHLIINGAGCFSRADNATIREL